MSLGAVRQDEKPEYGTMIAPLLYAPNHQHFFNMRLDFDLDGADNTVQRIDIIADAIDENNPFENAFHAQALNLVTEKQAKVNLNLETVLT